MLQLGERWTELLAAEPESGMGYQVVSVHLTDGRNFHRMTISGGRISAVPGCDAIPFTADQVARIVVTHDRARGA